MANIRKLVTEIPQEYTACRALGHAWKYYDVTEKKRDPVKRYRQELACIRCETHKAQFLDRGGRLRGTAYFYPKHYLIEGIGQLTADERAYIRLRAMNVL